MKERPLHISGIMEKILKKYKLLKEMRNCEVIIHWKDIFDEIIVKSTKPIKIKKDTLIVKVPDPLLAHSYTLHEEDFLKRIKEKFPESTIKRIKFKVGKL